MNLADHVAVENDGIPRRAAISKEECRRILSPETSQAVVLTDVIPQWPAATKWSFENLKLMCGEDTVILSDDLADPKHFRKRTLGEYLEYVVNPLEHPLSQEIEGVVWYAGYYSPFARHPELLRDFAPPEFLESWFEHLQGPMVDWYHRGFGWLLIGPAGTKTAPHFDLLSTHAWTAQIQGRKRFVFYPPDRQEPFDDVERVMKQKPVEVLLRAGEFMIIPADWCHAAYAIEPSCTLTFNFVNQTNFSRFLHSTYTSPGKWQSKVKDLELRAALGLSPLELAAPTSKERNANF